MATHQRSDFAEFADATSSELMRFAYALTGNRHDALDFVQETLFRVFRAWPRVRSGDNRRAYSKTAMVHLHLNWRRRASREASAYLRLQPADQGPVEADDGYDPWLREALNGLSPRQRTALLLVHVQGHSISETAALMAARENTVKTHLARAMEKLRCAAASTART